MSKKKKHYTTVKSVQTNDEFNPESASVQPNPNLTTDAFANAAAKLGIDQQNLLAASQYNFAPISRNRLQLDWAYRGSWIVRQAVDVIAEDMTRQGINVESDMTPDKIDKIYSAFSKMNIWGGINAGIKWSRLYGGSIVVLQIDGQDLSTPLRPETIGLGQFKGVRALDRWMLEPSLSEGELIHEPGPKQGLPVWYNVVVQAGGMPRGRIHHSRVIRFEGDELPFWQRQMENLWGLSVLEPLWDRLIAFDSTTTGAAQLVFKAYLRTIKLQNYRQAATTGGPLWQGVKQQLENIRIYQMTEGLTVLDATDDIVSSSYSFGGLSDVMIQFAQQLSGALGIPLVRLFGQSPAGLNSTGDSDIRNFYDRIKELQESVLREPVDLILRCLHMSLFGSLPGQDFSFDFRSLWQLTEVEKIDSAAKVTSSVSEAFQAGIVDKTIALKELNQSSNLTGVWSNITDEDIEQAAQEPPPMPPIAGGPPGSPGAGPGPTGPDGSPSGPDKFPSGHSGGPMGHELDALHGALKGRKLGGINTKSAEDKENLKTSSTGGSQSLKLKPSHELELLHHRVKGETLDSMTVYHGTKYNFKKFLPSHIGTGEGNDTYGKGIYLTDLPGTAEYYREELSGENSSKGPLTLNPLGGIVYKVSMDANRDDFINLDKNIDEQTPYIRMVLSEIGLNDLDEKPCIHVIDDNHSTLVDAGIVGNKYHDALSREENSGHDSYNYVVFDPSILHIVGKIDSGTNIETTADAYNPNEPRAPKGSEHGGEWTKGNNPNSSKLNEFNNLGKLINQAIKEHHERMDDKDNKVENKSKEQGELFNVTKLGEKKRNDEEIQQATKAHEFVKRLESNKKIKTVDPDSIFSRWEFPNLNSKNCFIINQPTHSYNCIAWALGYKKRWTWPDSSLFWPIPLLKDGDEKDNFDNLFRYLKAESLDIHDENSLKYEPGYVKVALYEDDYYGPTHLARQQSNGKWTSKMGANVGIVHDSPFTLNGGQYGNVAEIYKISEIEFYKLTHKNMFREK